MLPSVSVYFSVTGTPSPIPKELMASANCGAEVCNPVLGAVCEYYCASSVVLNGVLNLLSTTISIYANLGGIELKGSLATLALVLLATYQGKECHGGEESENVTKFHNFL